MEIVGWVVVGSGIVVNGRMVVGMGEVLGVAQYRPLLSKAVIWAVQYRFHKK